MRILHIVHQYMPEKVGGTELYTQSITQHQAALGHEVTLFTPATAVSELTLVEEHGVRIARASVGKRSPRETFASSFRDQTILAQFEQLLDQVQPHIVHVEHMMGLPQQMASLLATRNIPFVVTLWDFWWVCANAQLITNYDETICEGPELYINCARCALARVNWPQFAPALPLLALPLAARNRLLRQTLNHAARLLAPADFVRRWYVSHGAPAEKTIVLSPGLDVPTGWRQPSKAGEPEKRPFRAAYVGGLTWQKGVHLLVEAFASIDGELLIAGDLTADPAYVAALQEGAGANVQFVGRLERTAVFDLMTTVDVVVVTSLWYETFCFVISEAFAAGVPVVASKLGVLADRVQHQQDGLLFEAGNVVDLRRQLQRLATDPSLRAHLRQSLPPTPSMADHTANLLSTYATVLSEAEKIK